MSLLSFTPDSRWHRMGRRERAGTEAFFQAREARCVSACSRYLNRKTGDKVWVLPERRGAPEALLLYSRLCFFPIFDGRRDIPVPPFLASFFAKHPVHAIQGAPEDTEGLETLAERQGLAWADRFDYDLLTLDREPAPDCLHAGPPDLILRRPGPPDLDGLFPLQAAYEQEEVLPQGATFSPAASRQALEQLIRREYVLAAFLGGRLVGKINTNAASFSRCQIGGVYVLPAYRGQGIAARMTAVLARELLACGKGLTLFVKKQNLPAQAAYRRTGFQAAGNYRIVYY
jgi:ribosomal protein S18 acetylase RimI-like enzyme